MFEEAVHKLEVSVGEQQYSVVEFVRQYDAEVLIA